MLPVGRQAVVAGIDEGLECGSGAAPAAFVKLIFHKHYLCYTNYVKKRCCGKILHKEVGYGT